MSTRQRTSRDVATGSGERVLLLSKTQPPRVRSEWIERPHLLFRLNEGLHKRLILISAPAGFGKTTLAAQWLNSRAVRSAWLSLDEYDDDLEVFVRYLVTVLGAAVAEIVPKVESYLAAQMLPPPEFLADVVVVHLGTLNEPLFVVLDDSHTIHSPDVYLFLRRLLERAPGHFHLMMLTRTDPPWPLGRWRVSAWVEEIRAADLRFNLEETCSFFRQAGSSFPVDAIARAHERSEGWIASLHLLRLSAGRGVNAGSLIDTSGGEGLVLNYLMEEVAARQSPEVQEFFAVTSLFDRFCASLCDRVLGGPNPASSRTIADLERENQFLVRLDTEGKWYRYHHLFRTLLAEHLRPKASPESAARLYSLAGEWFASEGLTEEALRYFLAAHDFGRAATLVERTMHEIIDRDLARRELGRLCDLFPSSEQERYPSLLIARAYCDLNRWDLQAVAHRLERAESLLQGLGEDLPDERRRSLEGDIAAMRAGLHFWTGDGERALRDGLSAQQLVPRTHSYTRNVAVVHAAGGYSLLGQYDKAQQHIADALAEQETPGSSHSAHLYFARSVLCYFAGKLTDTITFAGHVLALAQSVPVSEFFLSNAYYIIGQVEYERNNLEAAADYLSLTGTMRYQANSRCYHDCFFGLALIALAKGDEVRAREFAHSARAFATEVPNAYSLAMSDSFEARLAFLTGTRRSSPPPLVKVVHSNRYYFELPPLTRAEYYLADPTPENCRTALAVIEEGLGNAERHHHVYQTIQFLAVKALGLAGVGRHKEALETIDRALRLAKPDGFVRAFVDRGPGMLALLQEVFAGDLENHYVKALLEAFAGKRAAGPTEAAAPGLLSNREIDVVLMLARRLTNKEIAQHLFVSDETVKKHTANIFRKLDAHGRREAVAAARKLGLIPPPDSGAL